MSSDELNLFSYEILGLVGRSGAGPHDLKRMVQRGRMLDWAGESRYYVEPRRLAKLGYLEARMEPGRTRERTVYSLTAKGCRALRDYAATPAEFQPLKSDLVLRFLIADLVGEEVTRASVGAMREDIASLRGRIEEMKAGADALPHRRKYLMLTIGFLEDLLDLHLAWIAKAERELGSAS